MKPRSIALEEAVGLPVVVGIAVVNKELAAVISDIEPVPGVAVGPVSFVPISETIRLSIVV